MLRFEQRDKLAGLSINLDRSGRDDLFKSPIISPEFHMGVLKNQHITVQANAEVTGYNVPFLRGCCRVVRVL
jgi:hypothetical protein